MSGPAQVRQPATWGDLERVPEGCVGEIVGGELVVHPRPDAPHTEAASDLGFLLGARFRFGTGGPGGWVSLIEPRVRFGEEIRVPDVAGWHKERFVSPAKGPYVVIPDWVCEVLSPGTARSDRMQKLPLYARHHVEHAWLVDPVVQTLEVYRREGERWLLSATFGGGETVRAEPFDAVELDLTMVWGPERAASEEEDR